MTESELLEKLRAILIWNENRNDVASIAICFILNKIEELIEEIEKNKKA